MSDKSIQLNSTLERRDANADQMSAPSAIQDNLIALFRESTQSGSRNSESLKPLPALTISFDASPAGQETKKQQEANAQRLQDIAVKAQSLKIRDSLLDREAPSARSKSGYVAEKLPERHLSGNAHLVGATEKELPNFDKVDEHTFRGGLPESKEALQKLKDQGVTSVIDFRGPVPLENVPENMRGDFERKNQKLAEHQAQEKKWAEELGLTYTNIPMTSGDGPTKEQIEQFLELAGLEQEENGKVYAHDEHGADREGAMMYAYRIVFSDFTPEQARKEMMDHGYRTRADGSDVYKNMTATVESWAQEHLKKRARLEAR